MKLLERLIENTKNKINYLKEFSFPLSIAKDEELYQHLTKDIFVDLIIILSVAKQQANDHEKIYFTRYITTLRTSNYTDILENNKISPDKVERLFKQIERFKDYVVKPKCSDSLFLSDSILFNLVNLYDYLNGTFKLRKVGLL